MKKIISKIVLSVSMLVLAISMLFVSACSDNDYPESRTFIVTDRKSFEKIMADNFTEFEVDFDKEMIVVYTFSTEYVLPAKIADVELNDNTLTVNYNIEHIPGALSARAPFQRWFIVKLDKLEITSVENSVSNVYKDIEEEIQTEENLAYNAKLFDECSPDCTWIKENYQKKNRVKGAIYY